VKLFTLQVGKRNLKPVDHLGGGDRRVRSVCSSTKSYLANKVEPFVGEQQQNGLSMYFKNFLVSLRLSKLMLRFSTFQHGGLLKTISQDFTSCEGISMCRTKKTSTSFRAAPAIACSSLPLKLYSHFVSPRERNPAALALGSANRANLPSLGSS